METNKLAKARAEAEEAELEKQYYRAGPSKATLLPSVGGAAGSFMGLSPLAYRGVTTSPPP